MTITDGARLVSTVSEDETHRFARRMGLPAYLYQDRDPHSPHYELATAQALRRALDMGARRVDSDELQARAWWAKQGVTA